MCNRSSWRLRKYHGAFDGFGVTSALARFSRGALMRTDRRRNVIVNNTAEMNSTKTRSGQTSTSSSRSRFGRGRAVVAGARGLWASIATEPVSLQRPRHAAVTADAPEVHRHENRRQQRQRDHMQSVESDQRALAYLKPAEDDQLRLITEVRRGAANA